MPRNREPQNQSHHRPKAKVQPPSHPKRMRPQISHRQRQPEQRSHRYRGQKNFPATPPTPGYSETHGAQHRCPARTKHRPSAVETDTLAPPPPPPASPPAASARRSQPPPYVSEIQPPNATRPCRFCVSSRGNTAAKTIPTRSPPRRPTRSPNPAAPAGEAPPPDHRPASRPNPATENPAPPEKGKTVPPSSVSSASR